MLLLIRAKLNYAELMRNFSYKLLVIITDSILRFSPGDGKLMHDAQSHSRKINMILLMTLAAMVTLFISRDIFRTICWHKTKYVNQIGRGDDSIMAI